MIRIIVSARPQIYCRLSLAVLERLGAPPPCLPLPWGRLGAVLARLGAVLGPSWAVLGPSWAVLGPSWGRPGAVLGRSGEVLGGHGEGLGVSWTLLG